jgi:DNA modification methylase
MPRDAVNELHPTQKPVSLAQRAIGNHNVSTIADFFAGSGSTIIAAENLYRQCRAIEISPAYCAVILQRYLDAFGIQPICQ